jgi:peptide/nickel transport system substrate-binding protein
MLAAANIQALIYDGPIDSTGFSYQPVILQKLPSLLDGDAVINLVNVTAGALVVDNEGNPVTLTAKTAEAAGTRVRPSGCRASACSVEYDGTNVTSMDQMVVTFRLLPGLLWSDGTPLTAADSVYSYHLNGAPGSIAQSNYALDRTASYVAADDVTTVWTGLPGFLDQSYMIEFWQPLPQHIMGRYSAADLITQFDAQGLWLGWGPYVIDEYRQGEDIRLSRNPYYFRSSEGLPHFDRLMFRFYYTDETTLVSALQTGKCDIVSEHALLQVVPLENMLALDHSGQIKALISTGTAWEHLDFNIRPAESIINSGAFAGWDLDGDGQGPFGDARLRQSIAMCLNRQGLVDTMLLGQSPVLDNYLPPGHPLFNARATHWQYDPAAAAALLDDIGWLDEDGDPSTPRIARGVTGVPDGTPLAMNYETTDSVLRQQVTQFLAQGLAGCGIQVNLIYRPPSEWFAPAPQGRLYGRLYDLGEYAWLTGITPPCNLLLSDQIPTAENGWTGENPGFIDPAYDTACNRQLQSLPGEAAYIQGVMDAQRIFAEQLPVVPLFLRVKYSAARTDMCGFWQDPTSLSEFWNIENIDYGSGCR